MVELEEREATEAVADKEAAETAAHAALMKEANLEVPTCLLACLLSCCLLACLLGLACLPACLLACLPACLPACSLPCVLALCACGSFVSPHIVLVSVCTQ